MNEKGQSLPIVEADAAPEPESEPEPGAAPGPVAGDRASGDSPDR